MRYSTSVANVSGDSAPAAGFTVIANTVLLGLRPSNTYTSWDKSVDIYGERFVATGADAVEVWEKQGLFWSRVTTLVGSDTQSGDEFARSVALYDRVIVAGAP